MHSLYYPAVLGTGLVLWIHKAANHPDLASAAADTSLYFGLVLVAFFSASYLRTEARPPGSYGAVPFLLDLGEIVLLFLAFFFLGYLDIGRAGTEQWQRFYLTVAAIPVLQQLWNLTLKNRVFLPLAAIAVAVLLAAAAAIDRFPWVNFAMLPVLALLLARYFYVLRRLGWSALSGDD